GKRWITYGVGPNNDYILSRSERGWDVTHEGRKLGTMRPSMPGQHNALNALAATLAGMQAGIAFELAASAVEQFGGVDRRFQHKATIRGIDFYDDYGHHPTEVRAVLSGFKEKFPDRRLVTIFQPHRYSRTQICWNEFLTCFKSADVLYVLDVYAAGEAALPQVSGDRLAREVDHPDCHYHSRAKDPQLVTIKETLKPGDVVLTLGAGDVSRLGEQMMESFAKGQA
ncbi:MAG: glutamate ligase domain-containing protein, partial [Bdellovibrionales bacterium]